MLDALRTALAADPRQVPLRLHLAELLAASGEAAHAAEAIAVVAGLLVDDPTHAQARTLMATLLAGHGPRRSTARSSRHGSRAPTRSFPPRRLPQRRHRPPPSSTGTAAESDLFRLRPGDDRFDVETPSIFAWPTSAA